MRKPRPATYNPVQALHLIANDRNGSQTGPAIGPVFAFSGLACTSVTLQVHKTCPFV
jgi:hypothetical protein